MRRKCDNAKRLVFPDDPADFRLPSEHMFAFICRVQLALDALDRLVDTLEERGTLSAVEAARSLFATSSISDGLACSLLAEVTAGDSRVVCAGATVSLAGGRADPLLEEAEFVVFDLETTGLSAAAQPHLRGRGRPRPGARARRLLRVARQPGRRAPGTGRPAHRPARAGAAARTVRARPSCGGSSPSPATTCSSRTTPSSTSASSSGSCSCCTVDACPSRRSARPRSPVACSRAAYAASASPRSPTSSAFRRGRATAPSPTPRRRPRCWCT